VRRQSQTALAALEEGLATYAPKPSERPRRVANAVAASVHQP